MLECVINVSEGRDGELITAIAEAAGDCLLDVHSDADHNRSVLTLAGPEVEYGARGVTFAAVTTIDLRRHDGVHPRLGAVDVVPFVPLEGSTLEDAVMARDRFAGWAAAELDLPCFLYGPERSLPEVRRQAFVDLLPDRGPEAPHPSAGAVCAGARPLLVAYNVWLAPGVDVQVAKTVAASVRGPMVRALGLQVGGSAQVSLNLVDPLRWGPDSAYDAVSAMAEVARAELVGLVPAALLERIDQRRWTELDLDPSRTIESRLAARPTTPDHPPGG